jgi:hypothetical protein
MNKYFIVSEISSFFSLKCKKVEQMSLVCFQQDSGERRSPLCIPGVPTEIILREQWELLGRWEGNKL